MNTTKLWLPNQLLHIFEKIKKDKLNISSTEKSILLCLSHFYPNIYPSYSMLENMTSFSRKCIMENIIKMEKKSILISEKRFDKCGDRSSNKFIINVQGIFKEVVTYGDYLVTYGDQGSHLGLPRVVTVSDPNYINKTNDLTKRSVARTNNEQKSLVPWFVAEPPVNVFTHSAWTHPPKTHDKEKETEVVKRIQKSFLDPVVEKEQSQEAMKRFSLDPSKPPTSHLRDIRMEFNSSNGVGKHGVSNAI